MSDVMDRSWLVQRLRKPLRPKNPDNPLAKVAAGLAFGGGYKNGGLTDKAMDLLREVWSFDYMGAAEYEWGEVPKALSKMAKNMDKLRGFEVRVPLKDVPPYWEDTREPPEGEAVVYVICPAAWKHEVEERVMQWATGNDGSEGSNPYRIRDATNLSLTLRPFNEWHSDVVGWLELDNGFMFFTDSEMYGKVCEMFGVK
jgi:hypothetical protein